MAKTSKIVKNEQRRAVVARYAGRRAELKRLIAAPGTSEQDRVAASGPRGIPARRPQIQLVAVT